MRRIVRIDQTRGLRPLVRLLRRYEAASGPLQSLKRRRDHMIATFERGRELPGELELIRDPSGKTAPPDGSSLVFRGKIYAVGRPARVLAFRRSGAERAGRRSSLRELRREGRGAAREARRERRSHPPGEFMYWMDMEWLSAEFEAIEPVQSGEYRVWFGTNRKPADPDDLSKGFSGARGGATRHGYCDVFVPESHQIGSIGSSALRRLWTRTDDRLKLRRTAGLEPDRFWASVAAQIAELEAGKRQAVVFIHGYNVSFEEAAIRAAQIGFDLGVGAMAFFSWPSKGLKTRRAYESDGQTIGASEDAIADFLADYAKRSGAEAVHVIVHSMGNQGVLRALNRILADAKRRGGYRFGQFILAAADVDSETFGSLADAYRKMTSRTTLYVSERDLALKVSAWFADYPRVGLYPPVSVFDGIDTVSVSNVDLTLLGHGYVGEARDVLQDMHRLIFDGTPPPRFGLRPRRNEEGKAYWEVGN